MKEEEDGKMLTPQSIMQHFCDFICCKRLVKRLRITQQPTEVIQLSSTTYTKTNKPWCTVHS